MIVLSTQAEFQMYKSDGRLKSKGKISMKAFCKRFWQDTQGQDLVEYALAAGMVAVAAVAAMPSLSTTIDTVFTKISSIISTSVN
jgi:pilus assembly protein Flp/PilA